jgi:hypothetical protein
VTWAPSCGQEALRAEWKRVSAGVVFFLLIYISGLSFPIKLSIHYRVMENRRNIEKYIPRHVVQFTNEFDDRKNYQIGSNIKQISLR